MRHVVLLFAALGPLAGVEGAVHAPPASLSVHGSEGWREWWRADRAPARWSGPEPAVASVVEWRPVAPEVHWGDLRLSGDGEAWRIRAILVRLDPKLVRLETRSLQRVDGRPLRWSVDSAPRKRSSPSMRGSSPRRDRGAGW